MVQKRRIDAPETIDTALHLLYKLQSDGWVLDALRQDVQYKRLSKKSPKLPTTIKLEIRLVPAK